MTTTPITREYIERMRFYLGQQGMCMDALCDAALAGLESRKRQGTIPKKYAKRRQIDEGSYVLVKRDQSNPAEANPNTDWMAVQKIPPQEDQPAEAKCFECNTPLVGPICPACNPAFSPSPDVEELVKRWKILRHDVHSHDHLTLVDFCEKAATALRQMQEERDDWESKCRLNCNGLVRYMNAATGLKQAIGCDADADGCEAIYQAAATLSALKAENEKLREVIRNISLQRLHLKNTSIWSIIERVFNLADATLAETKE